ncbi:MAG: hypothetical protein U0324_31310 [Polyangiales bacterium]
MGGRGAVAFVGLALVLALLGCRRKTDEEILRERLDAIQVHLYVASRFAVTAPEGDPHARVVRRSLATLMQTTTALAGAVRGAHSQGAASPAPPGLAIEDGPRLAVALWHLRAEARTLLRDAPGRDVPPVIPALLGARLGVDQTSVWTRDTEHALLLAAFLVLKFDEREPVPIPIELVLYEAWMARADRMPVPGLEPLVHAMKAAAYGLNDLCDLAAAEAGDPSLERDANARAATARSLERVTGASLHLDDRSLAVVDAGARAVAHGASAVCFYFSRHDRARGLRELRRFVEAAHAAGLPPVKTAALRAWIAYEDGDMTAARRALEEARSDPDASEETRRSLDQLLRDFELHNDGAVARYYDKAHLTLLVGRMALDALDRAGAFDAVKDSDVARSLRGYGAAATGVVAEARRHVPSLGDEARSAGSALDRVRRAVGLSR